MKASARLAKLHQLLALALAAAAVLSLPAGSARAQLISGEVVVTALTAEKGTGDGEGTVDGEGIAEGPVDGEGTVEGSIDGEGVTEGSAEGASEGAVEGSADGEGVSEGVVEGTAEGEGLAEGSIEGEGAIEGTPEGTVDGEGVLEGSTDGEGAIEGTLDGEGTFEGLPDGEGVLEGEGSIEGVVEGEGGGEGVVDLSNVVFVNQAVDIENGDGLSWETAVRRIQAGINIAANLGRTEVWVARGDYAEQRGSNGALVLSPGMAIYGGFDGTEDNTNDHDPERNVTIINGSTSNTGNPALNVVVGAEGVYLDGFVIRGGAGAGAGLKLQNGAMGIERCIFIENSSTTFGGGIIVANGALDIRDSVVRDNAAQIQGGGIALTGSTLYAENVLFYRNSTAGSGGALHVGGSSDTTLVRCRFTENLAELEGGAVYLSGGSGFTADASWFGRNTALQFGGAFRMVENDAALLRNCVFSLNRSEIHGGAISNNNASPTFQNCTFSGNAAVSRGSVMFNQVASLPVLNNCILAGNPGETIGNEDSSGATVSFSIVQGVVVAGLNNLTTNPLFTNPANENYGLQVGSPAIDTGTSANAPAEDFFGTARGIDGDGLGALGGDGSDFDRGAFEALEDGSVSGLVQDAREVPRLEHAADTSGNNKIELSELLRVIQFYNADGYVCDDGTEDGFAPQDPQTTGDTSCEPHSSDFIGPDFVINLSELLRGIQLFNAGGYFLCGGDEDGFCPFD
ncbi:MAG: hypothetical protein GC168_12870 [Candidatus Hydrogenedens sp.]|nr:hypothetical protein [Candidatus Hydrogenedens sp.]